MPPDKVVEAIKRTRDRIAFVDATAGELRRWVEHEYPDLEAWLIVEAAKILWESALRKRGNEEGRRPDRVLPPR